MEQADADRELGGGARHFLARHVQWIFVPVCLVAVALFLIFIAPSVLVATATPITSPVRLKSTISVTYLDKDGKVIGHQGPVAGRYVRLSELPSYVPQAFLAMEDRRFYSHHGVDFLGLSRAAYTNLRARRVVAGGSTITQQTAKLLFTNGNRTFNRKLQELKNAARLEKTFSKDQILEIYLNRIYLGEGTFGIDSASRNYFGLPASKLSLSQAAMLAGLTRAPTVYSPRRNLAVAQRRSRLVLSAMVQTGAISPNQAETAGRLPPAIIPERPDDHSYVLDAAAAEVQKLVSREEIGGRAFVVRTTVDSSLQAKGENAVRETVARLGPKLNFSQAALVLMDPDGSILSLVGGRDYRASVFDRVTQAHRQPGSAFKPFVYLAALERGISPWELRQDQPVNIAGYQPANYENASYGQLRLADALARSVNTVSVNLAEEVGIANVTAAARRLGIISPLHDNPSLALGTDEVTLLELTSAYAAFANGGNRIVPYLVTSISDSHGNILFSRSEPSKSPVLSDSVRRDMNAMLARVVEGGTGATARLPHREAAGKTGTTQDYRDAWFIGFTPNHVAGVWVGNDDNAPMRKVTGGSVPAQMWKTVMLAADGAIPAAKLDRSPAPPEIKSEQVVSPTYLDNPMQGSTFTDIPVVRTPEVSPPPEAAAPNTTLSSLASSPDRPVTAPGTDPAEPTGSTLQREHIAQERMAQERARDEVLQRSKTADEAEATYEARRAEYLRVLRQTTADRP